MQPKNYTAEAFIEFVGSIYVRAHQWAYDEGHGLFGRVIHEAAIADKPRWKNACEFGCMALLCDELIDVSERRRINRTDKGLFADACASLVDRYLEQFLHSVGMAAYPMHDYPKYLSTSVEHEFKEHGLLPRMVAQVLTRERNDLFAVKDYTNRDNLFRTTAHPMRTFVEWLDRLEHDKAVDPTGYKRQYTLRRRVVALHRVGLAMLSPETWRNAVEA